MHLITKIERVYNKYTKLLPFDTKFDHLFNRGYTPSDEVLEWMELLKYLREERVDLNLLLSNMNYDDSETLTISCSSVDEAIMNFNISKNVKGLTGFEYDSVSKTQTFSFRSQDREELQVTQST